MKASHLSTNLVGSLRKLKSDDTASSPSDPQDANTPFESSRTSNQSYIYAIISPFRSISFWEPSVIQVKPLPQLFESMAPPATNPMSMPIVRPTIWQMDLPLGMSIVFVRWGRSVVGYFSGLRMRAVGCMKAVTQPSNDKRQRQSVPNPQSITTRYSSDLDPTLRFLRIPVTSLVDQRYLLQP